MSKITTTKKPFANTGPYIGQPCTVRGIECTIVNILSFGTVEVSSLDDKHHYRISGLSF